MIKIPMPQANCVETVNPAVRRAPLCYSRSPAADVSGRLQIYDFIAAAVVLFATVSFVTLCVVIA